MISDHMAIFKKNICKFFILIYYFELATLHSSRHVDPIGVVVIILATGSEVHGSNSSGVDGFFQSVKILSMTFFGREVKP